MLLERTRFGIIEYTQSDVVTFLKGLIGFPHCKNFLLLHHRPESVFRWLQSIEEPSLAFLIVDPLAYVPNYAPPIHTEDATELSLQEDTPILIFTMVTIPRGKPQDMTLNLAGPLLINGVTRQAKQIIIEDEAFSIKHRVLPEDVPQEMKQIA
jgi:flagellar assembly factor FliW